VESKTVATQIVAGNRKPSKGVAGPVDFFPKGLNEGSQAIHSVGRAKNSARLNMLHAPHPLLYLATHIRLPYICCTKLPSIYLTFLRKCGRVLANGTGSIVCFGTASVLAGSLYGETSTPRAFLLLFFILAFLFGGFYLFIRFQKVISPQRRLQTFPLHKSHRSH
jgi:hypothetical protein